MRRTAALIPWLGLTTGAVLLTTAGRDVPGFATLGAVALVLALPGHATVSALYPDRKFDRAELVSLSIALSLSLAGLLALVLNWTDPGLTRTTWTIALAGVAMLGYLVAWARGSFSLRGPLPDDAIRSSTVVMAVVGVVGFGALAAVAFAIARHGAENQPRPDFFSLGIAQTGRSRVVVDLINRTKRTQTYRLSIRFQTRPLRATTVTVTPGRRVSSAVHLPRVADDAAPIVSAVLRESRGGRILRSVRLTVKPSATKRP